MGFSNWLRHGVWNTFEHGFTRMGDALASMVLVWVLAPEEYAQLAVAAAFIAPSLFFFLAPENILYREFSDWKALGPQSFAERMRALRLFARLKFVVALVLVLVLAALMPGEASWWEHVVVLAWAMTLALAPQLCGPDWTYLRLELELKKLSFLSFVQKAMILSSTLVVGFALQANLLALTGLVLGSTLISALISHWMANRVFEQQEIPTESLQVLKIPTDPQNLFAPVIRRSLVDFSFWNHLWGVITNWTHTMDVFFLGLLGMPQRSVGLYGVALKLANFSYLLPTALANLFNVWIGRRSKDADQSRERLVVIQYTGVLLVFALVQSMILYWCAPVILEWFSHGRWTIGEIASLHYWLAWILGGTALFSSCFLISSWFMLRTDPRRIGLQVYAPWGAGALVIYGCAVHQWGLNGAAWANIAVAGWFVMLLMVFVLRQKQPQR